jgi:hypothetical protein
MKRLLPLHYQKPAIEANRPLQLSGCPAILSAQPILQIRVALSRLVIPDYPRGQGPFGTHHDYQFLSPDNRCIKGDQVNHKKRSGLWSPLFNHMQRFKPRAQLILTTNTY